MASSSIFLPRHSVYIDRPCREASWLIDFITTLQTFPTENVPSLCQNVKSLRGIVRIFNFGL